MKIKLLALALGIGIIGVSSFTVFASNKTNTTQTNDKANSCCTDKANSCCTEKAACCK